MKVAHCEGGATLGLTSDTFAYCCWTDCLMGVLVSLLHVQEGEEGQRGREEGEPQEGGIGMKAAPGNWVSGPYLEPHQLGRCRRCAGTTPNWIITASQGEGHVQSIPCQY
jgi:hypothetical protein